MATFTGYRCDVCGKASEDRSDWLRLTPQVKSTGNDGWDICSDRCLATFAKLRLKAAGHPAPRVASQP